MNATNNKNNDTVALFKFHEVMFSDEHLGSGKTAIEYFVEFLSHLDFSSLKKIRIPGDFIGGWELLGRKQHAFPEMERRALDILNYAASLGIEVEIMGGNHDEKLRPLVDMLNNLRHHNKTFPSTLTFKQTSEYRVTVPPNREALLKSNGAFEVKTPVRTTSFVGIVKEFFWPASCQHWQGFG